MQKLISMMLVCILAFSLCACSSEPVLVSTEPQNNGETTAPVATEESKIFSLGDTVELDDVTVTFVDIIENKGSKYNKPADGKIFVLCEFEITNNAQEEVNVSSMLSFEAYCDDYACDYSLNALMEKGDKSQLDGTIAAGKKMKGVIGYEIPKDWAKLEIQYTVDVWDDGKIVFVATNE